MKETPTAAASKARVTISFLLFLTAFFIIKQSCEEIIECSKTTNDSVSKRLRAAKTVVGTGANKVLVVNYVGGIRESLFRELKEHDIKIIFRSLNPDPEEAKEAERCGADIIVATGFDEGGTLPDMTLGTFSIVPLIVDAVDHVPVMAAGGISNSRAFNAVMALGAEGAYCGTAFLMSKESRMAENVKQAVLKANAKDLLLFRTMPAYYRSLPGALANKLVEMDRAGATNEELGKTMGGFANLRKGMLDGDMENGYVSVGNGISDIHEIKSAKDIIDEMTKDYCK
nr:nitronate monooxygenase [uncultured Ruminococcus sp.]